MNATSLSELGLGKFVALAVLALGLLVPVQMIKNLVGSRALREQDMRLELQEKWGGPVTLTGVVARVRSEGGRWLYLAPEQLKVDGKLLTTERYRGLFRYPTYEAELTLSAKFAIPESVETIDDSDSEWIILGEEEQALPFLTQIESGIRTQIGRDSGILGPTYSGPIEWSGRRTEVKLNLTLTGAEALSFRPIARSSTVALGGDWGSPSFDGDRLPNARSVGADGFSADWQIDRMVDLVSVTAPYDLDLNPAVGVRLIEAVSDYRVIGRSVKYALVVITLTFASLLLFEVAAGVRIHLVQYALVGLALVSFYLLLLSQAEFLGFTLAYLVSSAPVVMLVTFYNQAVLGEWRRALLSGAGLSLTYAVLYPILREERFALLAGSWALFLALALLMILTRRFDWSTATLWQSKESTGDA
ncbi:MAG: cell envelope integrity protein CreD [Myxococcota bacterium]